MRRPSYSTYSPVFAKILVFLSFCLFFLSLPDMLRYSGVTFKKINYYHSNVISFLAESVDITIKYVNPALIIKFNGQFRQ